MNLDDLLKSIREEDDDSKGGKDLDDLLESIREEGVETDKKLDDLLKSIRNEDTSSTINPAKFFDNDKYDDYYKELVDEGSIDDLNLSEEERQKGIAAFRSNKLDFKKFVLDIQSLKPEVEQFNQEPLTIREQFFTAPKIEPSKLIPAESEPKIEPSKLIPAESEETPKIEPSKLIPSKDVEISEEFNEKLDELISVIRKDNQLEEERLKLENLDDEKEKRKKREERIENKKQTKSFLSNLKKSTGSLDGIFDKLKRFLTFALLGGVLSTLYNFIMDPKNDAMIKAVQGFLKDWWPALAAGIAFILTPFKGLITGTIKFLASTTLKILKLFATNPIFAIAVGAGVAGVMDYLKGEQRKSKLKKEVKELMEKEDISETEARKRLIEQKQKEKEEIGFTANPLDERVQELRKEMEQLKNIDFERSNYGFNLSGDAVNRAPGFEKELTTDQELFINPGTGAGQVPSMKAFSGGAMVTAPSGSTGMSMGTDKVHSLLTPGEIVFSRPSVSYWGADTLLAMNKIGGGTNRPKVGKVMGYQGGGFVISPEERRMLDAISGAEGTKGYGTLYGGKNIPELAKGEMTINQVLNMQETGLYKGMSVYAGGKYASAATGRYQFMPDVLREEANRYGYDLDKTKFTPQLQDELILRRIRRMRGVTPEMLKSEGMSDRVIDMLAPEFASFPNLFGPDAQGRYGTNSSYYGQPGKSAEYIKGLYNKSDGKGETKLPQLPHIPNSPTMKGSLGPAFDSDLNIKSQQKINNNFNNIGQKLSNPLETFVFTPLRRALGVGTPNIPTETRNFMMPPVETPKQNQSSNQTGDIPVFNISSGNRMRDLISKDLGIDDLVGASS